MQRDSSDIPEHLKQGAPCSEPIVTESDWTEWLLSAMDSFPRRVATCETRNHALQAGPHNRNDEPSNRICNMLSLSDEETDPEEPSAVVAEAGLTASLKLRSDLPQRTSYEISSSALMPQRTLKHLLLANGVTYVGATSDRDTSLSLRFLYVDHAEAYGTLFNIVK